MTFKTTITREIEVEVEYDYTKASRGARDRYGAPEEPDDPESVEIVSVKDVETGRDVELSDAEEKLLEDEAFGDVRAERDNALEARAEARAEQREWNRNNPLKDE